jgi:hypothetical protein
LICAVDGNGPQVELHQDAHGVVGALLPAEIDIGEAAVVVVWLSRRNEGGFRGGQLHGRVDAIFVYAIIDDRVLGAVGHLRQFRDGDMRGQFHAVGNWRWRQTRRTGQHLRQAGE